MAFIVHHGIKGMKWGVRRTPEELGYAKKTKRIRVLTKDEKEQRNKTRKERKKEEQERYKARGTIARESSNIIRTASQLEERIHESEVRRQNAKRISEMSDEELRTFINRRNLEEQYYRMTSTNVSIGRSYVKDTLEIAGSATATIASTIAIIASIKKLKG